VESEDGVQKVLETAKASEATKATTALIESIGERFRPPGVGDPKANDSERGFMFVLFEEQPLQNLRAVVSRLGDELCAFAEVPKDRVRLGKWPSVVEDERRNTQCWVEAAEDRGAIGAVDDIHCSAVVRDVEVGKKQPHLVTVARHRAVIEQHRHISDVAVFLSLSRIFSLGGSAGAPGRRPPPLAVSRSGTGHSGQDRNTHTSPSAGLSRETRRGGDYVATTSE
jgi:hypothetical protein